MIHMPMKYPFGSVGSIVLTGFEQSLQGTVARCVAAKVIQHDGHIVCLVEHERTGRETLGAMTDLLRGLETDLQVLDRLHVIDNVNEYQTAETLAAAIKAKVETPTLIIRDASHYMLPLNTEQWLPISDELALTLDVPVLTATHHGPSGPPAPNYSKIEADEVWTATAGLNLALTLKRWKPRTEVVRLRGRVLHNGGQYLFENETVQELGHAH